MMKKIAVFCSGSGSDFQSIIDLNEKENFCKIALMIASKENIYALERAKKHNIPYAVYEKKNYNSLTEMFDKIYKKLAEFKIDYIILAGYLCIMPKEFVNSFKDKIINIHPSLIPSFCGKDYYGLKVHQAVIDYGAKISGCTVHFVDENADSGAIIMQEAVKVEQNDNAESLQKKILEVEHIILPLCVKLLTTNKIEKIDRKVIIKE